MRPELKPSGAAWVTTLLLALAVVVVVLVAGDPGSPEADPPAGTSAAEPDEAVDPPVKATPAEWCSAFRAFADAQGRYVAGPDDQDSKTALGASATELVDLGQPLGLDAGGFQSLLDLVGATLGEAGLPAPADTTEPPDPRAFDAYLAASCPP